MVAAGRGRKGNGQSTAALSAATASSFTGNLRAARCVARHAGSMLSGGRSRSCATALPFSLAPEASDVASTRPLRQRPRSRSDTFTRAKPEHRSKKGAEGKARAARLRPYGKRGRALPRRARPPPAAERGGGGAPSPGGSSVATSLPRSRWSTRTCASSSRSPSPLSRPRRCLPRPDQGGHTRLEPCGREVRLAARLEVLDLRSLVDPSGGRAHDCDLARTIRPRFHVI